MQHQPINDLSKAVIGAAMEVHRCLGPGLLESAYEECLCRELQIVHISYERQRPLPVTYKGVQLDCGYRIDMVVDNRLVLEIKSVEQILPIHKAQTLTYLRLGGWQLGLLINFNVPVLKQGIHCLVLGLEESG